VIDDAARTLDIRCMATCRVRQPKRCRRPATTSCDTNTGRSVRGSTFQRAANRQSSSAWAQVKCEERWICAAQDRSYVSSIVAVSALPAACAARSVPIVVVIASESLAGGFAPLNIQE
jgi:hypothetical protein